MMTILLAWMLADLLSGIGHWYQDKMLVGESRFAFLNLLKEGNDLHHAKPLAMLKESLWGNINSTIPVTLPCAAVGFWVGAPTFIWLGIFFASFSNLTHRYAHMPRHKCPPWARVLQKTGIFISPAQHNLHHYRMGKVLAKQDTTEIYCTMTCWLNPIIDFLFRRNGPRSK